MYYRLLCGGTIVLMAVLLTACDTLVNFPDDIQAVDDPARRWQQRQIQLSAIEHWKINGRLAVTQGAEVWHISVNWQQREQNYIIHLSGPFGLGSVKLAGDQNGVNIQSKDEHFFASDAEQLLYQQTGVRIPIQNLKFWIRGLSSPRFEVTSQKLDKRGRLNLLSQNDWSINFKRYIQTHKIELPNKIFIKKQGIDIRFVIEDWIIKS